ncbi:hypothetical protein MCHI_003154 [Candidatus Magnetoovum chiemensis]|nr:hypothetical protein MCHI_003154 [Candidatus Magnetoovum chiemensis]
MTKKDIYHRIIARMSKISYDTFQTSTMDDVENRYNRQRYFDYIKAKDKIALLNDKIFISAGQISPISLKSIKYNIAHVKKETGCDKVLVVIDSLDSFSSDFNSNINISKDDYIINEFKSIQINSNAVFILISRAKKGSPQPSAAQSSPDKNLPAAAEQIGIEYLGDAGMVLMSADELNNKRNSDAPFLGDFEKLPNLKCIDNTKLEQLNLYLIIVKNRFGRAGKIALRFNPEIASFEEAV